MKEKKFFYKDIYWVQAQQNGNIKLFPIIFSFDYKNCLDIFHDKIYDAKGALEIPIEMFKDLNQKGEVQYLYDFKDLEIASEGVLSFQHDLFHLGEFIDCAQSLEVSPLTLRFYALRYQQSLKKIQKRKLTEFNSRNFGKDKLNLANIYTNYSTKFKLQDIYWLVGEKGDGTTHFIPYVVLTDGFGNNHLKDLSYSNIFGYAVPFCPDKSKRFGLEIVLALKYEYGSLYKNYRAYSSSDLQKKFDISLIDNKSMQESCDSVVNRNQINDIRDALKQKINKKMLQENASSSQQDDEKSL